jgi:hypothetical protein
MKRVVVLLFCVSNLIHGFQVGFKTFNRCAPFKSRRDKSRPYFVPFASFVVIVLSDSNSKLPLATFAAPGESARA